MKTAKALFVCMAAFPALSASLVVQAQAAQTNVKGSIARTNTFVKGTPAYEAIRRFIVNNTSDDEHGTLSDSATAPDSFIVTHTLQVNNATNFLLPQDATPIPLPSSGQPGDTISYSSCGGGVSQSWTWTWFTDDGWVETSYSRRRVTSCSSSGA
jgi:hypothetical protein